MLDNVTLFKREWAYLHKNMSGKFRVTKLGLTDEAFKPLKSADPRKWGTIADGLYFYAGRPVKVDLISTDPDLTDYFFPNGNFRANGYEMFSYLSNAKRTQNSDPYLAPATSLPASNTQGCKDIGVSGETLTNMPDLSQGYVPRPALEDKLHKLLSTGRHQVISLVGRGGIGKTSMALHVLRQVSHDAVYDGILWFSARDIDLLQSGPKLVRAHLLNENDMAKEFCSLIKQVYPINENDKPIDTFANALSSSPLEKPILFIFDNFETLTNPVQTYNWIDTYIRAPNKVLITSRFREFKGDYDVDVPGMEEKEATTLCSQFGQYLGINELLTDNVVEELYKESDGHPYVIKLLIGEIARQGKFVRFDRLMAAKSDVLDALFERSFVKLSPAAQLIFLTLSSWRSLIPRIAIEAVILRQANEMIDVEAAITELKQSSFIEVIEEAHDSEDQITVPLSAATFGKRKLEVSPLKISVEANMQLLLFFGAGQKTEVRKGIGPRIERFFRRIATEIAAGKATLVQCSPMLEYISRRYPQGWLLLAQLLEEDSGDPVAASEAVRRYIEAGEADLGMRREGWSRLVRLARARGDQSTEIQAMLEICVIPGSSFDDISEAANRLNTLVRLQAVQMPTDEKRLLTQKLLAMAEPRIEEADATDLSRFAWLAFNNADPDTARNYTVRGLALDPTNEYCLKLAERQGLLA